MDSPRYVTKFENFPRIGAKGSLEGEALCAFAGEIFLRVYCATLPIPDLLPLPQLTMLAH